MGLALLGSLDNATESRRERKLEPSVDSDSSALEGIEALLSRVQRTRLTFCASFSLYRHPMRLNMLESFFSSSAGLV
jgi:hypothetical protein